MFKKALLFGLMLASLAFIPMTGDRATAAEQKSYNISTELAHRWGGWGGWGGGWGYYRPYYYRPYYYAYPYNYYPYYYYPYQYRYWY